MELNMIDLKSGFERKLNQLLEEMPNRLTRELKSIEERDNFQWKDTKNKIGSQERLVTSLKTTLDKTVATLVQKVDTLQNNVEANKFKINNLTNLVDNKLDAMTSISKKQSSGGGSIPVNVELETEMRHLKDQLNEERVKREQDQEESQKLFYQLQQKLFSQEKEVLERLKEHRNYQLELFKSGEEERSKINIIKDEREDGNVEYLKNYIRTVERKLEDESAFRLKNEDDLREWFEQKVSSIHQKLKNEEKLSLDREKKMMEQLQESLVTIDEIINGTKEQNLISISKSQVLLNDNMSNLTETVESVKDSLTARMDEIEREIGENRGKLNDIQVSTYKHAQTVNDTLDKEIGRFEKIIGAFEKLLNSQVSELRETISNNDEKISKWKVSFEDLQTKKLLEIHSVLKLLNKNISKVSKDSKERYDLIQDQILKGQENVDGQFLDIRKKIEVNYTTLEDRVQLTVTKHTEKFDNEILNSIKDYNELVRKAKSALADTLDKNNDEIKQFIEQKNKEFRDKIQDDRIKNDLLLEGRCQAFSIDIEKRMKEKMFMTKEETENTFKQFTKETKRISDSLENYKVEVNKKIKEEEKSIKEWSKDELKREIETVNILIYEKVEESKMSVSKDFNEKLEKEKKQRNERLNELNLLMESSKNLINEHIRNQVDSLRSLSKALVAKESSERTKEYENLMRILSARIESVDNSLRNKIDEETEKQNVRLDTFKTDMDSMKETHEKRLEGHDIAIEENTQSIEDHYKEYKEAMYKLERDTQSKLEKSEKKIKEDIEIRSLINSMTEHIVNEERKAKFNNLKLFVEKSLNELNKIMNDTNHKLIIRIDSLELATTADNIFNRAAIDRLDEKYEEALLEVANSIDSYIGVVNDTSNKQYDDFNKNLKSEFGKNLEQIQDILNNLRDEIDGQKEKVNDMELNIHKSEINSKKSIDKVRERIEIERLVNDLVSWVAEEKQIDRFEIINNKNAKLSLITSQVDKKAESALDGINQLQILREKELGEVEKRREEKLKKELEEREKKDKEAQEKKERKEKEEKEKKDKELKDEEVKKEKLKKEEEEKKEKQRKEEEEKKERLRKEDELKEKQRRDEEDKREKERIYREEKDRKSEDVEIKKEIENLKEQQNKRIEELELKLRKDYDKLHEENKKDNDEIKASFKKQFDENKEEVKKQIEKSKEENKEEVKKLLEKEKEENKKVLDQHKEETKKLIDKSQENLIKDFTSLKEKNDKEIKELEERMVLEFEDNDKKMNRQIELNEKWKNEMESKMDKSK